MSDTLESLLLSRAAELKKDNHNAMVSAEKEREQRRSSLLEKFPADFIYEELMGSVKKMSTLDISRGYIRVEITVPSEMKKIAMNHYSDLEWYGEKVLENSRCPGKLRNVRIFLRELKELRYYYCRDTVWDYEIILPCSLYSLGESDDAE